MSQGPLRGLNELILIKCLERVQGPVSCSVVGVAVSAVGRWNTEGTLCTVGELAMSRPLIPKTRKQPQEGKWALHSALHSDPSAPLPPWVALGELPFFSEPLSVSSYKVTQKVSLLGPQ